MVWLRVMEGREEYHQEDDKYADTGVAKEKKGKA